MAELEEMVGIPKVISFLSSLLQRVSESNDQRKVREDTKMISGFYGLSRPTISINSYLKRIFKYANCSLSCFVVAYVYLDRFVQNHPSFPIDSFNVHRLLITSVLVSAKFLDDFMWLVVLHRSVNDREIAKPLRFCIYSYYRCYNNAYYAKVGGISTMEMNLLELDFLFGLKFQLNVSPNAFHIYCSYLQSEMLLTTQPKLQIQTPIKLHSFTEEETSLKKQLTV